MIKFIAMTIDAANGHVEYERTGYPPVLGPVDYAFAKTEKENCLVIGKGLFAGSILPGANRLIFAGKSPSWGGFYISTMGGAALIFDRLGVYFIAIKGKAKTLSTLVLRRKEGQVEVSLEPADAGKIWSEGYKGKRGVYALAQSVFDNHGDKFAKCRILATGYAALKTNMGAIYSAPIKKGEISPVDTWAGRGGFGTKLVRDHGVAAIIFGGDYDEPDNWRNRLEIDNEFIRRYDNSMIKTDIELTKKYRFDPNVESGGTFGVNYSTLKDRTLMFNYSSIFWKKEKRLESYNRLIKSHYLKQFNDETIAKKKFKNCGEPCPAVCKKMWGKYKKDYEPYQALGPLVGVFDQREAEKLNHYCDELGFDAIQIGGITAWVMELLWKKILKPKQLGLKSTPAFSPSGFDVKEDSGKNAEIAMKIIDLVLSDRPLGLNTGPRIAVREFKKAFGKDVKDFAVYVPFGKTGSVIPNQYWAPGLFAPMAIMGKYFQYYKSDYHPPFDLGVKCAKRMVKELYSDNNGMCRFHRGWVENILDELIEKHYGRKIDLEVHHFKLAVKIHKSNKPVFWESERVLDLIYTYLINSGADNLDKNLAFWISEFARDKGKGGRKYWDEILKGVNSVLGE